MAPVQFTYSLMTRSLRVSHASVAKRDPHLAHGVEQLLAASVGVTGEPPSPTALPFALGDRRARSRIVIAAGAATDVARGIGVVDGAALAGAGIVVVAGFAHDTNGSSDRGIARIPQTGRSGGVPAPGDPRAWAAIVNRVHDQGALIIARLEVAAGALEAVAVAVERAGSAGFDMILLDAGIYAAELEVLPAAIAAARTVWRAGGWIAAVVHDRPAARAAVIGHAAQLVRAGADLLWVSAPSDSPLAHGARLPAAPLADRLRNELDVATAIECGDALLPDLDAAIAAGRADLVVVGRPPEGARAP
jgi:anthraniloyl-CoA monooxygenase